MPEEYDLILEVVAKHPGMTVDEITDLARDHGITATDIPASFWKRSATTIFSSLMIGTG